MSGDYEVLTVTSDAALRDACARLRAVGRFAFDTEFVGEDTYQPEVCLLQAATDEFCVLVDPLGGVNPTPLWELVSDPDVQVLMHAGSEDLTMCWKQLGRPAANVFDLQIAAGLVGMDYPISLARLARATVGRAIPKSETLTDWRKRPLNSAQLEYAVADVRYLPAIHRRLEEKLIGMGRLDWAREECDQLCQAVTTRSGTAQKVRRLRGAGTLAPKELAVAQLILEERDRLARELDRPARVVMKDHLVVEIARRGWTDTRRLSSLRGISIAKTHLARLAKAVEQGLRLPPEAWPEIETNDDRPDEDTLMTLVTAVLRDFCQGEGIAYGLLATRRDLRALVRNHTRRDAPPLPCALARGWRARAVGRLLDELLSGRAAVRVRAGADGILRLHME